MYETAKRMMRNLALMIEKFGFIPNGGRVYYLRRSQPPLLTAMVYEYYESNHTRVKDNNFLKEMLPVLEKEVEFWDTRRNVTVKDPNTGEIYQAYRYFAESNVPRPESFKEDMASSVNMTDEEKIFFYQSVASAAESEFSQVFSGRQETNLVPTTTVNASQQ
uniref:Trehalase n=1 Tax=Ditylenchus dipsaci TaxID=166011 RepID=A0A915D1Y5_9BILA